MKTLDEVTEVQLDAYAHEAAAALNAILHYWAQHTPDEMHGGFYGRIDGHNEVHSTAAKGLVMHARILWAFAAAYRHTKNETQLAMAYRAFDFINQYFYDAQHGGMYWSVTADGKPLDSRNQIYGLAFCMYGMSELYAATKDDKALAIAVELYNTIERYSFDPVYKGYVEAFANDWSPLQDQRLSEKDANTAKTMNTHLHIVEAYANLYCNWPDEQLKQQIIGLLQVFDQHIIDPESGHLLLFFDAAWNVQPDVISFGHDIEASWLLLECAAVIKDKFWIGRMQQHAITLALAAKEGLDKDGALWYELEPLQQQLIKEKHWWLQAEAMVGFYNAWRITKEPAFLQDSLSVWAFIKKYLVDENAGEWYWGIDAKGKPMQQEDKAGFWKCPYHNARACMMMAHPRNWIMEPFYPS